jgi:CreA protein
MKMFKVAHMFVISLIVLLTCSAVQSEMLGKIETSGMLFKDTLEVHAFDDPDIAGITCYVTLPKRSLSITDQTDTSISCRKVGHISGRIASKKKIFKNKKSWFIKSMFIDRIYDKNRNVVVYISYTKKMSGDNANNSVSVVALN